MAINRCNIAHPSQKPACNTRGATRPASDFGGAIIGKPHAKLGRLIGQNDRQFITAIELQPHLDAKAVPQRRGQQSSTGSRPDQREGRQIDPH